MGSNKKHSLAPSPDKRPEKRVLDGNARRQMYLLIVNSLLLLFLYFGSMSIRTVVIPAGVLTEYPIFFGQVVYVAYWVAFTAFLMAYLIYNRGFNRKGITVDMLPDSWSQEQKEEYVADGKRRMERSKWMLSVLIPLLVTIAADAIYLFTWPMIQNLFHLS